MHVHFPCFLGEGGGGGGGIQMNECGREAEMPVAFQCSLCFNQINFVDSEATFPVTRITRAAATSSYSSRRPFQDSDKNLNDGKRPQKTKEGWRVVVCEGWGGGGGGGRTETQTNRQRQTGAETNTDRKRQRDTDKQREKE